MWHHYVQVIVDMLTLVVSVFLYCEYVLSVMMWLACTVLLQREEATVWKRGGDVVHRRRGSCWRVRSGISGEFRGVSYKKRKKK